MIYHKMIVGPARLSALFAIACPKGNVSQDKYDGQVELPSIDLKRKLSCLHVYRRHAYTHQTL